MACRGICHRIKADSLGINHNTRYAEGQSVVKYVKFFYFGQIIIDFVVVVT